MWTWDNEKDIGIVEEDTAQCLFFYKNIAFYSGSELYHKRCSANIKSLPCSVARLVNWTSVKISLDQKCLCSNWTSQMDACTGWNVMVSCAVQSRWPAWPFRPLKSITLFLFLCIIWIQSSKLEVSLVQAATVALLGGI